jgi:hypothetical protein
MTRQQLVMLSPSVRISEVLGSWREGDVAKLREAYRLVGIPE